MNYTTVMADAERLCWWAVRTFGYDRRELRQVLDGWLMMSPFALKEELAHAIADHVARTHAAHSEEEARAGRAARAATASLRVAE